MSKIVIPLKIVTPKNKLVSRFNVSDALTLDVNGRSYSPQNLEDIINSDLGYMHQTLDSIYQCKKFKVRTASNFVKTSRNYRKLPFQRIRKVEKAINQEKEFERQSNIQNITVLPQFKKIQVNVKQKKKQRHKDEFDLQKKVEAIRLKQIQQLIKSSRQQQKQRRNIIKFEQKLNSFEANELITLDRCNLQVSTPRGYKEGFLANKSNLYADIIKNRKKLNQKRHIKKKSGDHSLLGRINYLQQNQELNFILRNSLDRSQLGSHRQ